MKPILRSAVILIAAMGLLISCGGSGSSDATDGNGTLIIKGSALAPGSSTSAVKSDSALMHGSPTSVKMKFYAVYLSESTDCSDPIKVADFGTDGIEFEMFDNPTIVDTTVAEGTYPCLIVEASDIMGFKPDQDAADFFAGACDTATEYSFDAYRTGEEDSDQWIDLDGQSITALGTVDAPGESRIFFFASTDSTAPTANGVAVHHNQKATLVSPMVVPGQTIFYIDPSDRVSSPDIGTGPKCWLEGFEAGFQS